MRLISRLFLWGGLFFTLGLNPVGKVFAAPVSAPVPLHSYVYPLLEKFAGLGLIKSSLVGTKPWSRMEVARQVTEVRRNAEDIPRTMSAMYARLLSEFKVELAEIGGSSSANSYFKPVRNPSLSYVYRHGDSSTIPSKSISQPRGEVDAAQFALTINNDGVDYGEQQNVQLEFESELRVSDWGLLSWRPLFLGTSLDGDEHFSLETLQALAVLGVGPFEFSLGRQSLWWGQGHNGTLVLTNNAKPLDMLRLNNPSPVLLPWIFKALGPFRFDMFLSRLEADRVVPEPYFGGLRLNFKPRPWLELGASRTMIFGGDGRPSVGFSDFMAILGGTNLLGDEDTSNQLAALDARVRLPMLFDAEVYGEWGGEDQSNGPPFISNKAYLVGFYLPRIDPASRFSARFELADLSRLDDNSSPWYRHSIYASGYTHAGRLMGHSVGGAGEDWFGQLETVLPGGGQANLVFDYQKRGVDHPVAEKHRKILLSASFPLSSDFEISFSGGLDWIDNFNMVSGAEQTQSLASASFSGQF